MITNHHIAMQFAAERQRELRAAGGGGWRLADLFGRRAARRAAGRAAEGTPSARDSDALAPAGAGGNARRRPEPRIRRAPAAPGVHRASAPRRDRDARRAERTRS